MCRFQASCSLRILGKNLQQTLEFSWIHVDEVGCHLPINNSGARPVWRGISYLGNSTCYHDSWNTWMFLYPMKIRPLILSHPWVQKPSHFGVLKGVVTCCHLVPGIHSGAYSEHRILQQEFELPGPPPSPNCRAAWEINVGTMRTRSCSGGCNLVFFNFFCGSKMRWFTVSFELNK